MAVAPTSTWGRASVVINCVLLSLAWITTVARVFVRRKIKGLGLDDYLMCLALVIYTVDIPLVLLGLYNGVGSYDKDLNDYYQESGRKWTVISQMIYIATIAPIKCSICVALLRITTQRRIKYALYTIIFISVASAAITEVVILSWCKPLSAQWKPAQIPTKCGSFSIITSISYFLGATSIATDWACAILPVVIFWNVQLKRRIKVSLVTVLSLGVLASTATLVRFAFVLSITSQMNYLFSVSKVTIWGTIESGIGIIAGSLATLRPLLKHIPFLSYAGMGARSRTSDALYPNSYRLERVDNLSRASGYKAMCAGTDGGPRDPSDAESQKHILKETTLIIQHQDRDDVDM